MQYNVYKLFPDGSGELFASFVYKAYAYKFINSFNIGDLTTKVSKTDMISLVIIDMESGELCESVCLIGDSFD